MKHARLILPVIAVLFVVVAAVLGALGNIAWALVAAMMGIIVVVLVASFIQIRTMQSATQRLSGLQKQQQRLYQSVQNVHTKLATKHTAVSSTKAAARAAGEPVTVWPAGEGGSEQELRSSIEALQTAIDDIAFMQRQQMSELRDLRARHTRHELRALLQDVDDVEVIDD